MEDQGTGPGPPYCGAEAMHWRRQDTEGEEQEEEEVHGLKGEECFTDCELQSVCSSITDPFSSDASEMGDHEEDVMERPDHVLVYISSSPWTEQGWRLYHDEDNDEPEDEEHANLTPRFLRPITLGQALDLTDQCVFITEPAYPYSVVHANSAFTRLSEYNFHEIARRPCLFLQGPGADSASFQELLSDVAQSGFGRCSMVNHTRRSEPFLNRLSVVPVVNRTYQIPRMTHLLWTCRATFQGCCNLPSVPSGPVYPPMGGLETIQQPTPQQPTPLFTKPSLPLPLPSQADHNQQSRRSARASVAASAGRFAPQPQHKPCPNTNTRKRARPSPSSPQAASPQPLPPPPHYTTQPPLQPWTWGPETSWAAPGVVKQEREPPATRHEALPLRQQERAARQEEPLMRQEAMRQPMCGNWPALDHAQPLLFAPQRPPEASGYSPGVSRGGFGVGTLGGRHMGGGAQMGGGASMLPSWPSATSLPVLCI